MHSATPVRDAFRPEETVLFTRHLVVSLARLTQQPAAAIPAVPQREMPFKDCAHVVGEDILHAELHGAPALPRSQGLVGMNIVEGQVSNWWRRQG